MDALRLRPTGLAGCQAAGLPPPPPVAERSVTLKVDNPGAAVLQQQRAYLQRGPRRLLLGAGCRRLPGAS